MSIPQYSHPHFFKLFTITLCLLFSNFLCTYAQTPEIKFTNLSREQGLSSGLVNCTYQDSKGYMWIGTDDGLNRYDGYQVTVYKNKPGVTTSISGNSINQIIEDKKHRIWIATNYGLNIYDRAQDKFIQFVNIPGSANSISSNMVLSVYEDLNGKIWTGTSTGLNLFDEQHKTFKHFPIGVNLNTSANVINFIYQKSKTQLWLCTDGAGIKQFDIGTGRFTSLGDSKLQQLNSLRVCVITEYINHKIWIGTTGNGAFLYDTEANTIKKFSHQLADKQSLSSNGIKDILCDHLHNIWISNENGGVNIYQPATETFAHYENDPQNPSSFPQKTASSLYEDTQHNIWIGTHRGGVSIYAPNAYKFKTYTQGNLPGQLSYKDIKTFFEDNKGNIWVGTDGGGINVWNRKANIFSQYRYSPYNPNSLGSDAVLDIMRDHKGNIWVATWGGGLNLYNSATGTFTRFLHNDKDPFSITSNDVWRILEDKDGKIWVATFYGGLNLFDPETKKFTRVINAPDGKSHFIGSRLFTLHQDEQNNIWIGTEDGGLSCLTANKQKFINYFSDNQRDLTDAIRVVYTDNEHRLWVGKTGLYLFNKKKNSFVLFSSNPYLVNERIEAIIEDSKGFLWISTSNGLCKFNPETGYLKKFTDADGLQGLDFCQNACLRLRSGELLFGGFKGFNLFDPDNIKKNNYSYPIYITGLQLFNKSIQRGGADSPIDEDISQARVISLDHNQSVFSFEYAALNYVAPAKTQYAYKLKDFDKNWNYVGNQRKATYTNLDPGTYTFFVKASNPDGLWNTAPASIDVIIKPPFWMTWWFRLISVIVLCGVAYAGLYYRRKAELKMFYEQKKEEMHQLQLQFFTNISHEFRTPLTLILGTLEQILKIDTTSLFTRHYHTIHRNANRLLYLISELMDFRKAESGVLKLKVAEGDFSLFLADIMKEFKEQALQHHINLSVNEENSYDNIWFDKQVVEKILLNLINNSFKYTADHGEIKIEVTSTLDAITPFYENSIKVESEYKGHEYIYISITDNGIGISKDSIHHLFERYYRISDHHLGSGVGLAFVKSLIGLHKGSVYIYSEHKQGTQIIIALPCSRGDYTNDEMWLGNSAETGVQLESVKYREVLSNSEKIIQDEIFIADKSTPRQCILLVDDNDELRAYFKEVLEPYYYIIEAENGEAGILKVKNESPALIISDVMMPVMDGNEFCAIIKNDFETSHIPFILLTAKDALESRMQGMESGADYYFSKPVSLDLLLVTIKNLFKQRLKIKERYLKDYQVEVRDLVHTEKDKKFMDRLLKIIEQKLEDPDLNVEYVSREIGISKTMLYKKIKDITGQSMIEFIRTIRLKKAIEIMTHEDVLVTEVMYRVGIQSQSYFTNIFKKEFNITPSQFQQQLNKKETAKSQE